MTIDPIRRLDGERVRQLRADLVGANLISVAYTQTRFGGLAVPASGSVHEVDLDVRLSLSTGTVVVSWEHYDRLEWLSVQRAFNGDATAPAGVVAVGDSDSLVLDAAEVAEWKMHLGRKIADVQFRWHSSEAGGTEVLCALRMELESNRSVLIALGELDSKGLPAYYPESLLVFFDTAAARAYVGLEEFDSA